MTPTWHLASYLQYDGGSGFQLQHPRYTKRFKLRIGVIDKVAVVECHQSLHIVQFEAKLIWPLRHLLLPGQTDGQLGGLAQHGCRAQHLAQLAQDRDREEKRYICIYTKWVQGEKCCGFEVRRGRHHVSKVTSLASLQLKLWQTSTWMCTYAKKSDEQSEWLIYFTKEPGDSMKTGSSSMSKSTQKNLLECFCKRKPLNEVQLGSVPLSGFDVWRFRSDY